REALGGDCGFRQVGYLCLLGERTVATGRQVLRLERDHGVEVREVSPDDIKKIMPASSLDGIVAGVLEPQSGYADPVRTTHALVERAKAWGLLVYEGVGVTGIQCRDNRVTSVETEQGTIATPVVVNAAGPWGRHLGLSAGLNYSLRWSRES